jgi:Secretion system C-terminal sorting domain
MKTKLLIFFVLTLIFFKGSAQTLFTENFEGVLNSSTNLPNKWSETGLSDNELYFVGDSVDANYTVNNQSQWLVPSHSKFVMTNDLMCSYEEGNSKCNKQQDRLILPKLAFKKSSLSLVLEFSSFFTAKYGAKAVVQISRDQQQSWTTIGSVINHPKKWQTNTLDISSYLGDTSVYVSFLYDDVSTVNDGLAIDDVSIKLIKKWKDVSLDFVSVSNYSIIPIAQVNSIPLNVVFHNAGSLKIDSTIVRVQIFDVSVPNRLVASFSKKHTNIIVKDTISTLLGSFIPNEKKKYKIVHSLITVADTIRTNDTLTTFLQISTHEFARDLGLKSEIFELDEVQKITENQVSIGNLFQINEKSSIDSLFFGLLKSEKTNGLQFRALVYKFFSKDSLIAVGKSDVVSMDQLTINGSGVYLKIFDDFGQKLILDTGRYMMVYNKLPGSSSTGLYLSTRYFNEKTIFVSKTNEFNLFEDFSPNTRKVPIIRCFVTPICKLYSVVSVTPSECGKVTGKIAVRVLSGQRPYKYYLNGNLKDSVISFISVGEHALKIIDNKGCVFDSSRVKMEYFPSPKLIVDSIKHPTCYNFSNGYISVTTQLKNKLVEIVWDGKKSTLTTLKNTKAGIHTVSVMDDKFCKDSILIPLQNPDSLQVKSYVFGEEQGNDGKIFFSIKGGTAPYSCLWEDKKDTISREDLKGKLTYKIIVSDKNKCSKTFSLFVPSTLSLEELTTIYSVYPNPFNDFIRIKDVIGSLEVKLVDLNGSLILQKMYNHSENIGSIDLDVGLLNSGIYFLILNNSTRIKVVKN